MKILFFGDTQIGAGASYGSTPHGVGSRLNDQANMLKTIADLVEREHVDVVVHGGDVFERRNPTVAEILSFTPFVEAVTRHAELVLVVGNHDCAGVNYPNVQRLFGGIQGVTVAEQPDVVIDRSDYAIATLPWTPTDRLVTALDGDREHLSEHVAATLIEEAAGLAAACTAGTKKILVGHWAVEGARLPNGLPVDQLREPVLSQDDLRATGFDAYLFSHIHTGGHFAAAMLYSGSPWVCDWGEAGLIHGVWLIDTDRLQRDDQGADFEPVVDRRFVTINLDLTTDRHDELTLSETEALRAQCDLHGKVLDDAVVRFKVRATPEQAARLDWPAIHRRCAELGAAKVHGAAVEQVRAERARVEGLDEGVGALAAVDIYLDRQDWDGFAKATARQRAAEHLEQVQP